MFRIRNYVSNSGKAKEKEIVQSLEGAVGRQGHGQCSQHVGSDRVLLLDISSEIFCTPSQGKLQGEVFGGRRNVNVEEKFVVSPDS